MRVGVEFHAYNHLGGPISDEPYEGFFQQRGFARKADGTFCDLRDTVLQILEIGSMQKKDEAPYFSPGMALIAERTILYSGEHLCFAFPEKGVRMNSGGTEVSLKSLDEVLKREENGEDTASLIKSQLDAVQKAGGAAWHGYIVNIATSSSSQFAVLEEDFSSAQEKIEGLVHFATETAVLLYSSLRKSALKMLYERLGPVYERLVAAVQTRQHEVDMGKFNALLQSLPEEQYALTMQELLEEPILTWLPAVVEEMERAGIIQCDEKLYGDVALYCQTHEIPLPKGEFGNSFRKVALSSIFERLHD